MTAVKVQVPEFHCMCCLQGKHVLQSSLQTAPCNYQPTSVCTTVAPSATPEIRVPTSCDSDHHKCQSSPMPPLCARTAMPPVVDQPASYTMAQECLSSPAINAQSQHFPRPNDANAASRVIHRAASSAAAGAFNRLSGAISAEMLAGSLILGDRSLADQAGAMPPGAVHPQSLITDACKMRSTSPDPQRLPTATDTPLTHQWASGALATYMPASTPSEASATAEILAEPPVATAQAMECLTAEESANRLPVRQWHPTDRQEPLPPQPSSIFGSPEASASEEHGEAARDTGSANSESTVASSEPAQTQSCQTLLHQQSKAGSPFTAFKVADAKSCLVAPPGYPQASAPQLGSTCASSPDMVSSSTDAGSAMNDGPTVSRAQVHTPPSGWSSASVLPASPDANHKIAAPSASDSTGLPVICPLPDASIAGMVSPEALASDVMEVISRQGAPCDTSWLAARTSAPHRQESSSGR